MSINARRCCCTCTCIKCAASFNCGPNTVIPPNADPNVGTSQCWVDSTSARCRDLQFTFNATGTVALAQEATLKYDVDEFGTCIQKIICTPGVVSMITTGFNGGDYACADWCTNPCVTPPWHECGYAYSWSGSVTVRIPKVYSSAGCPGGANACCWPGTTSLYESSLVRTAVTQDLNGIPDITFGSYTPCSSGITIYIRPWIHGRTGPKTGTANDCKGGCYSYPICSQEGGQPNMISAPYWNGAGSYPYPQYAGCIRLTYVPDIASGGVVGNWKLVYWQINAPLPGTGGGFGGSAVGYYPYRNYECIVYPPYPANWPPATSGNDAYSLYQAALVNVPPTITLTEI